MLILNSQELVHLIVSGYRVHTSDGEAYDGGAVHGTGYVTDARRERSEVPCLGQPRSTEGVVGLAQQQHLRDKGVMDSLRPGFLGLCL